MDFFFRIALISVAYFYPAYKCFKLIDRGKPNSEQLHIWCQYWIIIAIFTGFERITDPFISWLPFYSGAKLAFVVYLWHPDTKGTEYVYQAFLKSFVSNNMESMEFNFGLLRDEATRVLGILWTRLLLETQARASELLRQNVIESPSVACRPLQGTIPQNPAVSASFYWKNLQQQGPPLRLSHHSLITQSAVWPDDVYKKEGHGSSNPMQSSLSSLVEQRKQLNPALKYHALASQRDFKVPDSGEFVAASVPPSTRDHKDNGSDKEETDFELVHFSEVPKHGSNEAILCSKAKISAQAARSKWWW